MLSKIQETANVIARICNDIRKNCNTFSIPKMLADWHQLRLQLMFCRHSAESYNQAVETEQDLYDVCTSRADIMRVRVSRACTDM